MPRLYTKCDKDLLKAFKQKCEIIRCAFLKDLPGCTLESELENGRSGFGESNLEAISFDQVKSDGSQTRVVAAEIHRGILQGPVIVIAMHINDILC